MSVILYKIECLTNLHAGSGDINYNIIDNEVERDPVFGLATINSSSVKGALREHFERTGGLSGLNIAEINRIFDKEAKDKDGKKQDTEKGEYKFLRADLIARPMRVSNGSEPYANVACYEALKAFTDYISALGIRQYKLPERPEKQFHCKKKQ